MRSPSSSLALALLLSPTLLLAQTAPAKTEPTKDTKDDKPLQTVEVKGSASDYDPRRDDTASKTVLNAEEIRKHGDTNVYDVLKRAPGVTVTGNTIRMRGLGAGYTQILVNGERPPPGFSLDTLMPDQIEKIEIIRAASAEYSMQAIAGTINIVLRNVVSKPQRDLRIGAFRSSESENAFVNGTWGGKKGNLSYVLTGSLYRGRSGYDFTSADQFFLPSGALERSRVSRSSNTSNSRGAQLYPRLSWKLDNGDTLNLNMFVTHGPNRSSSRWRTTNLVGAFPSPDWRRNDSDYEMSFLWWRAEVNWIAKLAGGKLDLTASADGNKMTNDMASEQFTANDALRLERVWNTTTRYKGRLLRAKYTRSMFDGHSLVAGINASMDNDDETRDRLEQLGTAPQTRRIDTFQPRITRFAGFIQDEWNVTKQWSVYLGTRWEGVRTTSAGTGLAETRSRNHVLSPVAQTLYKFPDKSGRQLRLAVTRTYKAPTTNQLTARRYESTVNSEFAPDSSGNPALKPELATGVDLTYEHFWAPAAQFSVTASSRAITDYIRTRLGVDAQGRWLYQPLNDGKAQVRSLQAEVKLPLKLVNPALAAFDARASVSRNWSRVSTVPGPNNRLDEQVPLSANAGIDYKKDKLSLGASFATTQSGWVQVSESQSNWQNGRRELDAYALWKFNANYQARLSLANMLGSARRSERLYVNASGRSRQATEQPASMRTQVTLEMKF